MRKHIWALGISISEHLDRQPFNVFYFIMDNELLLKRKLTFRFGDQKLILVKKTVESARHVIMKALL